MVTSALPTLDANEMSHTCHLHPLKSLGALKPLETLF